MQILRMLLDRGANPGQAAENGWTPLYIAAKNGHDEVHCGLMCCCIASY
jgi:ankyrin repeat protein